MFKSPIALHAYRNWQRSWKRGTGFADRSLMKRGPVHWKSAEPMVRWVGDWSAHLADLPRLPARRLSGPRGELIHVGDDAGARLMKHVLFDGEARVESLGRVPLTGLGKSIDRWLSVGTDLVVCDTSPVFVPASEAPVQFAVPEWVNQSLHIPRDANQLLAGKRMARYRNYINRAVKEGFGFRYTRSPDAFDHFHRSIYRPFVERRHGELARTTPYRAQRWWFDRGGLLLLCRNGDPVGGALTYVAGDDCFQLDVGVLEEEDESTRHLNKLLVWFNILWARQQGASRINLGGTRPWRTNGSFRAKNKWGARVVRRQRPYRMWRFFADQVPEPMARHIDDLGLVVEYRGRMLGLRTGRDDQEVDRLLADAAADGLDGIYRLPPPGEHRRPAFALQAVP